MHIIGLLTIALVSAVAAPRAQAPESFQPVGTMSELMVSMVYPAANELLLFVHRGAPKDDKEWAAAQRSAILLAESGNVLILRGGARDPEWTKDARMLVDVGAAAYRAARAKDANALLALDAPLNASCVTCHKQYRPNVHPRR